MIQMKELDDKSEDSTNIAKEFEEEPFIGPHSIVIDKRDSKYR